MNIVLASFLFTIFLNVVKCRILNKTILIQQYGYSEDALSIDLNGLSIDSIEIGTKTTTKNAGKMNCKIIQKIIFNII